MPRPTLTVAQVSEWMLELAKDPPTSEGLLTEFDLRDMRCWPELALAIREDGTPEWWPGWHPEVERKLTAEERRRWFMEVLTDDLRSETDTLLTADVALRWRIIARSLIELQTTFEIESFPPPDFIDTRELSPGTPPRPSSPAPEPTDPSEIEDKAVADAIEQAAREARRKRRRSSDTPDAGVTAPPKAMRVGGKPGPPRVRRNLDGSITYLPGEE